MYSARSTTGSRRSTAALARDVQVGEPHPQRRSARRPDAGRRRRGWRRACAPPRVALDGLLVEPHEVAVGVEDDAWAAGSCRRMRSRSTPEGVRLAGAALAAPEGVPVEAVGHERDAHRLLAREVAEVQLGSPPDSRCWTVSGRVGRTATSCHGESAGSARRAGPATDLHEGAGGGEARGRTGRPRRPRRRRARRPRPRARGSRRAPAARAPGRARRRTSRPMTPDG